VPPSNLGSGGSESRVSPGYCVPGSPISRNKHKCLQERKTYRGEEISWPCVCWSLRSRASQNRHFRKRIETKDKVSIFLCVAWFAKDW